MSTPTDAQVEAAARVAQQSLERLRAWAAGRGH
jgi:hypothetical protein